MTKKGVKDSMRTFPMTTSPGFITWKLIDITISLLTQPNMYARGVLWGKMKYELGDHSVVKCPENKLVADIDFKTKGYFSGTYNAIWGTIRNEETGEVFYELSGFWNGEMYIKDVAVRISSPDIFVSLTLNPLFFLL